MKKWNKILALTLAVLTVLSCFAFVACSDDTNEPPKTDDKTPGTDAPGTDAPVVTRPMMKTRAKTTS